MYRTRVGFPSTFSCYCADLILEAALKGTSSRCCPGLVIHTAPEQERQSDVTVASNSPGRITISRTKNLNRVHRSSTLIFRDDFSHGMAVGAELKRVDLENLVRILYQAASFYHHLKREGPIKPSNVSVELLRVQMNLDDVYVPMEGGRLYIRDNTVEITLAHSEDNCFSDPVGMRLFNDNEFNLHFYVFYFNPMTLKIRECLLPLLVTYFVSHNNHDQCNGINLPMQLANPTSNCQERRELISASSLATSPLWDSVSHEG